MVYLNLKNGARITSSCEISGGDWQLLEAADPLETNLVEKTKKVEKVEKVKKVTKNGRLCNDK